MRSRIIAVIAAVGVLVTAGVASANGDETDPRVDTLFTYGYDAQTQLFFTNTHATDSIPLDCTLAGRLAATYGAVDEDGAVAVDHLSDGSDTVIFEATGYELTEGIEAATGAAPYDGAEGECGIAGVTVGTQGHINHGQFMKLFNQLIDMQGRGCLNRSLAQSELGKDAQQVKTEDFTDPELGSAGTIDFVTVAADCDHDHQDQAEDHPGRGRDNHGTTATSGNGHGRPDSPGKSDDAARQNKDK